MRKKTSVSQVPQSSPETLICTVCGKEFTKNDYTKYIINGGYTCSWKCFIDEAKRKDAERAKNNEDKSNKRRKK
jgi:predicted  nucleic acid-binding Zn-ribbon protein